MSTRSENKRFGFAIEKSTRGTGGTGHSAGEHNRKNPLDGAGIGASG